MKQNNGITLISLVITIIVMLILAGVTVVAVINGGLIGKAGDARDKWNDAQQNELNQMDDIEKTIAQYTGETSGETISKDVTEMENNNISYIGYFADVDNDGEVDGVIFADLLVGGSGQWCDEMGAFSYDSVVATKLKDYEVSQTSYSVEDAPGYEAKPVIKASSTTGTDRFWVMSLSDFTTSEYSTFCWYNSLYEQNYTSSTESVFGSGKKNTVTMISEWTEDSDGQNARDMWGVIKQKVYGLESSNDDIAGKTVNDVKWFVPSNAEWGAFGCSFGLTELNYEDFGFDGCPYWSSSVSRTDHAYNAYFKNGYVDNIGNFTNEFCVRLAATF